MGRGEGGVGNQKRKSFEIYRSKARAEENKSKFVGLIKKVLEKQN